MQEYEKEHFVSQKQAATAGLDMTAEKENEFPTKTLNSKPIKGTIVSSTYYKKLYYELASKDEAGIAQP